jgi:ferritin
MEKLITEEEQKVLNVFGLFELTASHTYLHLANRMKSLSYFGAEKFFLSESNDEREHYEKISEFCNDMGSELSVEQLDAVTSTITDIKGALEMAYQMEKDLLTAYEEAVTKDLSMKVKIFLYDYVTFQVKAVGEYGDLLARLALTNDMLLFDKDLAN